MLCLAAVWVVHSANAKFSAAFPLLHLSSSQLLASMICLFSFVKERPHKADCKGSREFYRVKSAAED